MKEIIGSKRVSNISLPNFIKVKTRVFCQFYQGEKQSFCVHSRKQNDIPKLYSL